MNAKSLTYEEIRAKNCVRSGTIEFFFRGL
jgi:hypothetical protein